MLDNKVVSAPRINSQINDQGVIEGTASRRNQAADLALILRSGSLPASLTSLEERTVGPSLGRDSIRQGILASADRLHRADPGRAPLLQGAGVNAVLALLLNLVILLGMMASSRPR